MKFAIALLLMLAPFAAHGQMLKCVGKDGKVEYASQCPPGTKEIQTGIRNAPVGVATGDAPQQKSLAEREADFRKRQTEGAEARQKEEKKAAEDPGAARPTANRRAAYLKSLQTAIAFPSVDPENRRARLPRRSRPAR